MRRVPIICVLLGLVAVLAGCGDTAVTPSRVDLLAKIGDALGANRPGVLHVKMRETASPGTVVELWTLNAKGTDFLYASRTREMSERGLEDSSTVVRRDGSGVDHSAARAAGGARITLASAAAVARTEGRSASQFLQFVDEIRGGKLAYRRTRDTGGRRVAVFAGGDPALIGWGGGSGATFRVTDGDPAELMRLEVDEADGQPMILHTAGGVVTVPGEEPIDVPALTWRFEVVQVLPDDVATTRELFDLGEVYPRARRGADFRSMPLT